MSADPQRIALADADVRYQPDWLPEAAADVLLRALIDEIRWTQHHVRIFGRELPSPRLSAWIGDPGAVYTYSRVRHEPLPWTPALAVLRARLRAESGVEIGRASCRERV